MCNAQVTADEATSNNVYVRLDLHGPSARLPETGCGGWGGGLVGALKGNSDKLQGVPQPHTQLCMTSSVSAANMARIEHASRHSTCHDGSRTDSADGKRLTPTFDANAWSLATQGTDYAPALHNSMPMPQCLALVDPQTPWACTNTAIRALPQACRCMCMMLGPA